MPDAIRNLALVYPALCAPDDARKSFNPDGTKKDPNARLEKIEGAGHGFRGEPLEKAIQLISAQLEEWEKKRYSVRKL